MHKIALAFFLALFAMASLQRPCAAADDIDEAKDKDIQKLMDLTGAGKLGVQLMQQMTTMFRKQMPNVPTEFWDEFAKEANVGDLVKMVAPIYAKHFSHEEIKQLIAFYESPIGRKLVAEQSGIMTESMAIGQQWGQQLGAKIVQRLRERGYLPKA